MSLNALHSRPDPRSRFTFSHTPQYNCISDSSTHTDFDPITKLRRVAADCLHQEIYGVDLTDRTTAYQAQSILQNLLNYHNRDLNKAAVHLQAILNWRRRARPADPSRWALNRIRFAGITYATMYMSRNLMEKQYAEVIVWNRYTALLNYDGFDLLSWDKFIAGIIERVMQLLTSRLCDGVVTIKDPFQVTIVDDMPTGRLSQDKRVREAFEGIEAFRKFYPGYIKARYVINPPKTTKMMYSFVQALVGRLAMQAAATRNQFYYVNCREDLARVLSMHNNRLDTTQLPKEYGGQGEPLGRQVNMLSFPID